MNAELFYDLFKDGIRAVNSSWPDKSKIKVEVKGSYFIMKYDGLKFAIKLMEDKKK